MEHRQAGDDFASRGQWLKAAGCYSKALKAGAGEPELFERLVSALLTLSKTSKALAVADQGVAAHPDCMTTRGCWTRAMLAAARADEAFAALQPLPAEAEPLRYQAAVGARDAAAASAVPAVPSPSVIAYLEPTGEHWPYRLNLASRLRRGGELAGKYCAGCASEQPELLELCDRCQVAWFCPGCRGAQPGHQRWCELLRISRANSEAKASAAAGGGVDLQLPAAATEPAGGPLEGWEDYWRVRAEAVPRSRTLSRAMNQQLATHHLSTPLSIMWAARLAGIELNRPGPVRIDLVGAEEGAEGSSGEAILELAELYPAAELQLVMIGPLMQSKQARWTRHKTVVSTARALYQDYLMDQPPDLLVLINPGYRPVLGAGRAGDAGCMRAPEIAT